MTNFQFFRPSSVDSDTPEGLLSTITNLIGKLPRRAYQQFEDYEDLLDNFTSDNPQEVFMRKSLTTSFSPQYYSSAETKEAVDFLMYVFNADPSQRPTAAECLEHEWLSH